MTQMKPRNPTFYWYDYETFGVDPKRNRPAQFAGRRTGLDFEPVSEGEVFYCRPAMDQLPSPESSLLTGITPQLCEEKGLRETEFAQDVWERLMKSIASFSGEISSMLISTVGRTAAPGGISFLSSALLGRCGAMPSSGRSGKILIRRCTRRQPAEAASASSLNS